MCFLEVDKASIQRLPICLGLLDEGADDEGLISGAVWCGAVWCMTLEGDINIICLVDTTRCTHVALGYSARGCG